MKNICSCVFFAWHTNPLVKQKSALFLPVFFILWMMVIPAIGWAAPTVVITSNPAANANNLTICSGTSVTFTATVSNAVGPYIYKWKKNGLVVDTRNSDLDTSKHIETNLSIGDKITCEITNDGIAVTGVNIITVTVNPNPTLNVGGAVAPICQGGITAALGGSFGGGASAAVWSDGGAGGSFANNGGSTPGTATYTSSVTSGTPVTLTLTTSGGSCGPKSLNKSLTVNPNPTLNVGGAVAPICQGGTTSALSGSFGGGATAAVWSDGGAGGSFANNSGSTPGTATYTSSVTSGTPVTLTLTTSGGSCGPKSLNKSLTVNPNPTLNVGGAVAPICQGGITAALGGSFGGGASAAVWSDGGAGGSFANNGGSTPGTATYTASAISGTPVTLTLTTSGGSCSSILKSKSITVNPLPVVSSSIGTSDAICSGNTTNIDLKATTASTFAWTKTSSSGISGATDGTGTAIKQTLTNSSNATDGTVVYTVNATSTATPGCTGPDFKFTVTVNPSPVVSSSKGTTDAICSGNTTNIDLKATTASTFAWTKTSSSGISGATDGTGTAIKQTLANASNANSGTVVYTVNATSTTTNGCKGPDFKFTVNVNPLPDVTNGDTTICSENSPNIILKATATSNFAWIVTSTSLTGASDGAGATINQKLTNPSNLVPGSVQYKITATSTPQGCIGAAKTITVTVNPLPAKPDITAGPTSVCANTKNENFSASTSSTGVRYAWVVTGGGSLLNLQSPPVNPPALADSGKNAIISFGTAATTVKVQAIYNSTGCISHDSTRIVSVSAKSSSPAEAKVIYNLTDFVALNNSVKSYQWGFDSVNLRPFTLAGETFQNYFRPDAMKDTSKFAFWVKTTTADDCTTKNYFNNPKYYKTSRRIQPHPVENIPIYLVRISPNPARQQITVAWNTVTLQPTAISITTVGGQRAFIKSLPVNGDGYTNVNIAGLPGGVYFVQLLQNGKKPAVAKFVKQ